ncbi:MAG: chloride channel protein [Anaeromyxobacter sp.]
MKRAYALGDGRVPFRDALGKFLIGTLQIGSGASLGREGPTVQICAGATTLIARLTALPERNLRRLVPVAASAGIAAAFNAPIAAVTFTIEEIVGTLDHSVLSGVVVAAALASVIERSVLGVHPVIEAPVGLGLDHASSLVLYALLGVAAAAVSIIFTDGLLGLRSWFRGLRRVPAWAQPGVGGLVTGVLGAAVLAGLGVTGVNGGGYETLGLALEGKLALGALLALCGAKLAATLFSYSSGGAGGIFMPALFVGAMLGGAVGHLDVGVLGHEPRQLGAFALVGMGAVFAGVIRAPITSVLIIFEMTGAYGLILPLMLANVTSFVLARRHRPTPIYDALLAQDGIVLPHGAAVRLDDSATAAVEPLARELARSVGPEDHAAGLPQVGPDVPLSELASAIVEARAPALAVVGDDGRVTGVVTREVIAGTLLERRPPRPR